MVERWGEHMKVACGSFVRGNVSLTLSRAQDFLSVLVRVNKLAAGAATCPRSQASTFKLKTMRTLPSLTMTVSRLEGQWLKKKESKCGWLGLKKNML